MIRTRSAALAAGFALALAAQTLDTGILGTVTDPAGAVISGAAVTISSPATGFSRAVKTAADGKYEVRYLVPGEYTVEVQNPGFRDGAPRRSRHSDQSAGAHRFRDAGRRGAADG